MVKRMGQLRIVHHDGKHCCGVNHCSWHTGDNLYRLPRQALFVLSDIEGCNALIAINVKGKVVGVFKYKIRNSTLHAAGTFVTPSLRKSGLASHLWIKILKHEKPKTVYVTISTDKGLTLVSAMKRKFGQINWKIEEVGSRKLKVLKK